MESVVRDFATKTRLESSKERPASLLTTLSWRTPPKVLLAVSELTWGLQPGHPIFSRQSLADPSGRIAEGRCSASCVGGITIEADFMMGYAHGTGQLEIEPTEEEIAKSKEPLRPLLYEGEFKNGYMEGFGRLQLKQYGLHYTGFFTKSEFHGPGCLMKDEKWAYIGTFKGGQPEGLGLYRDLVNKVQYVGHFSHGGKANGFGRFSFLQTGTYHDACWRNNVRVGPSVWFDAKSRTYKCLLWYLQEPAQKATTELTSPGAASSSTHNPSTLSNPAGPQTPQLPTASLTESSTDGSGGVISKCTEEWPGAAAFLEKYKKAMETKDVFGDSEFGQLEDLMKQYEGKDESAETMQYLKQLKATVEVSKRNLFQIRNRVSDAVGLPYPEPLIPSAAREVFIEFFMEPHNHDLEFRAPEPSDQKIFDLKVMEVPTGDDPTAPMEKRYVRPLEYLEIEIRTRALSDEVLYTACSCKMCDFARKRKDALKRGAPFETLAEITHLTPIEMRRVLEASCRQAQQKRQEALDRITKAAAEKKRKEEQFMKALRDILAKRQENQKKKAQELEEEPSRTIAEFLDPEREAQKQELYDRVKKAGFIVHDVDPYGHCLFLAVLDQLGHINHPDKEINFLELRELVVSHLQSQGEKKKEFFLLDYASALDKNVEDLPEDTWENYLDGMRHQSWGDIYVVQALADIYNLRIVIFQTISIGKNPDKYGTFVIEPSAELHDATSAPQTIALGSLFNTHFVSLRYHTPEA